jgi:hypothetical protein
VTPAYSLAIDQIRISPLPDGGGLFIGERTATDFLLVLGNWGPCP